MLLTMVLGEWVFVLAVGADTDVYVQLGCGTVAISSNISIGLYCSLYCTPVICIIYYYYLLQYGITLVLRYHMARLMQFTLYTRRKFLGKSNK